MGKVQFSSHFFVKVFHFKQADGIHAVQLEMCWSAYIADEAEPRRWDESQGAAVQPLLRRLLETAVAWRPA